MIIVFFAILNGKKKRVYNRIKKEILFSLNNYKKPEILLNFGSQIICKFAFLFDSLSGLNDNSN